MSQRGENALIAWLRQRFPADAARVPVGIGDDAAVVRFGNALIAITTDMLLDGVHFDTREHSLEQIGRKAIACSLSDCAAMGCTPVAATTSIALPAVMSLSEVQRLYEGMGQMADRFDCPLVGGDTTSWPGRLAIDVALFGEPMSTRGPILRSGASPGDTIYVSGPLGGSILGRHLSFTPRLDLARRLVDEPELNAMMDLSDGLSMDLHRLCQASGFGAELETTLLEAAISDAARQRSAVTGRAPLDHALNDGEDFELLLTAGPGLPAQSLGLIPVGRITEAAPAGPTRMRLRHPDGHLSPVEPRGYEHFK
ncbi:MAG: thiamine-monophosphate kinase [Phycisphaerae bacterium]